MLNDNVCWYTSLWIGSNSAYIAVYMINKPTHKMIAIHIDTNTVYVYSNKKALTKLFDVGLDAIQSWFRYGVRCIEYEGWLVYCADEYIQHGYKKS